MEQKYEKYLPLGSVVLLNEATKKVMITGFCMKGDQNNEKIFDYVGCLYPEGIINTEQNLLFNHKDIKQIFAIGYSDEEDKQFKSKLLEELKNNNIVTGE